MESKMSEKKKFGFVVLHYCTLDMTRSVLQQFRRKWHRLIMKLW